MWWITFFYQFREECEIPCGGKYRVDDNLSSGAMVRMVDSIGGK